MYPIASGLFRNHGHLFIHDLETFRILMEEIGFKKNKKCNFREGDDKLLLKDSEYRRPESLFVEAYK